MSLASKSKHQLDYRSSDESQRAFQRGEGGCSAKRAFAVNLEADQMIETLELERENLIHALAAAQDSLQKVHDDTLRLPFAWILTDSRGTFVQVSDRAVVLLGRDRIEAPGGSNLLSHLDQKSQRAVRTAMVGFLAKRQAVDGSSANPPFIREARLSARPDEDRVCELRLEPYMLGGLTEAVFAVTLTERPGSSQPVDLERLAFALDKAHGHFVQMLPVDDILKPTRVLLPRPSDRGEFNLISGNGECNALLQTTAVQNGLRTLELEALARNAPCNWTYIPPVLGESGSSSASRPYVFHTFPMLDPAGRVEALGTIGFALDGVPERVLAGLASNDRGNIREHDVLTGCLSRDAILGLLEAEIAKARQSGTELSIASVDLDSFKGFNDGMGHHVGDALLKALSVRMRQAIGDNGLVGRLSGDEFLFLLPNRGPASARQLLDGFLDDIRRPLTVEGTELIATCSVGVASFPRHADHGLALVRASDLALYRSKDLGRDRVSVFEPEMQVARNRALKIINNLHRALAQEEFYLVYQPQFELAGARRMIGVEALIRWDDAELGAVSPAEFIPLGYQCGLGLAIDLWVIKTCLAQKALWDTAEAGLTVSINTSASSFLSVGFARKILSLINLHGLHPHHVHIEVTETTLMQSATICAENLDALRAAGVGISIDDFGTGYSSLAAIHALGPTQIKIDRSFISRIGEATPHATRPLELIMALAQSLQLQVVAEGIETEEQLDWLVAHGCHIGQGFLMSGPVEVGKILPGLAKTADRIQSTPLNASRRHSVTSKWLTTAPNS